jgi:hypothetical protein
MSLPVSVPLQPTHGRSITADRILLRLSSTLPFIGFLLYALASIFHHDPANSNNHIVTFTLYAANGFWTAVHLGQFVGRAGYSEPRASRPPIRSHSS